METKHWIIVYDVRDSKRLYKAAKCTESYALRVQKSVFETDAPDSVIATLKHRLESFLEDEDFVLFFEVCERDWQKREFFGTNEIGANVLKDDKFAIL